MKLSSRNELLNQADFELKKISESIRDIKRVKSESSDYDLDLKIRNLYKLVRDMERKKTTNESDWKSKSTKSRWASINRPTPTTPEKKEELRRIQQWEELNEKYIDSFSEYLEAATIMAEGEYKDIVLKSIPGSWTGKQNLVYRYDSVKKKFIPVPSKKDSSKIMTAGELFELYEEQVKTSRTGVKGFIQNLLDAFTWSMI